MFDKVVKNTVTNQVIEQVKGLLVSGALRIGDKLPPERQMAEQLGVSRPSLREALRALEFSGLLIPLPNGGVRVADGGTVLDNALQTTHLVRQFSLEKVLEARRCIELTTVRLAASRASDTARQELCRASEAFRLTVENDGDYVTADLAFHIAIARASGNDVLATMLQSCRAMLHEFSVEALSRSDERATALWHHQRILEAILQRNETEAVAHIEEHLDTLAVVLRLSF